MLHNANLYINHNSHASALKIVRKIVCLFTFSMRKVIIQPWTTALNKASVVTKNGNFTTF